MKFRYGKIFLLGFGFFGVSVIWGVYNALSRSSWQTSSMFHRV